MTKNIKKTSWTQSELTQQLEEDIALGLLNPRERLVEDDLCQRFSVTRHAVRQALAELEKIGLVEKKKNIGSLVRSYSIKEVIELYQIREILEVHAAKTILFPVPEKQIQALTKIQEKHDLAIIAGNLRQTFINNITFHRCFFSLCENQTLVIAIEDFALRTHAIRSQTILNAEIVQQAQTEHWALIQALKTQDRATLLDLCAQHLYPSRDFYLNYLRSREG